MFALMSVLPCSELFLPPLHRRPGNKLMSSRPASCLIWPPPECHFEFTSQVRKEEEREREELEFSERFWSATQRRRREGKERPGGGAVRSFVRSFAHACVAVACGMVTRL